MSNSNNIPTPKEMVELVKQGQPSRDENHRLRVESDIKSVSGLIRREAEKGETYVYITHALPPEVYSAFAEAGYVVEKRSTYVAIFWGKDDR